MPLPLYQGCLLAMLVAASSAATAPVVTLRHAAQSHVLIGTAVRPSLFSEAAYSATLAREFNMIEAEDGMKWWAVRPNADTFDFRAGDVAVGFAKVHDMKVRGHCLVWDHNNPDWLVHGVFPPRSVIKLVTAAHHSHDETLSGEVFAWDVVNEALDENGEVKNSLWYNQPGIGLSGKGTAYIEQAFRWAHDADPQALLFYNEAGGEGLNRKSDAIYAMVKDFKHRGVPMNGVGLQLHISQLDFDSTALAGNIARLTALGVQVHITELDVSLPVEASGIAGEHDLQQQAEVYRGVVHACLQSPGCPAIQTWGFTDKYSWIGSRSRGARGSALLFDRAYRPKPAYNAVLQELLQQKNGEQ